MPKIYGTSGTPDVVQNATNAAIDQIAAERGLSNEAKAFMSSRMCIIDTDKACAKADSVKELCEGNIEVRSTGHTALCRLDISILAQLKEGTIGSVQELVEANAKLRETAITKLFSAFDTAGAVTDWSAVKEAFRLAETTGMSGADFASSAIDSLNPGNPMSNAHQFTEAGKADIIKGLSPMGVD